MATCDKTQRYATDCLTFLLLSIPIFSWCTTHCLFKDKTEIMWVFIPYFPRDFIGMQLCLNQKFLCFFHAFFGDKFNKGHLHFLTEYTAKIIATDTDSTRNTI